MSLRTQLSLNENGGVYFSGTKVKPNKHVATLIVGLGGTGADGILRIKNEVKSRMELPRNEQNSLTADTPSNIAFLQVDADDESHRKSYGNASFDEFGNDFVHIAVDNLPRVIETVAATHPGDEIWNWYDRGVTNVAGREGAGGIRQIGRLHLFRNIDSVLGKISAAVSRIVSSPEINGLQIFLVSGIGGGTGSGILIDMAYILRHATRHQQNVQLLGYLIMPDLNGQNGGNLSSLYSNGFACLKELDFWMSVKEHRQRFVQKYSASCTVDMEDVPFDFCHIVADQDYAHNHITYNDALDAIAENIFAYLASEPGINTSGNDSMSSMYSNIGNYITQLAKPLPACYRYLSIGADKLQIPYKEITTLIASRVFARLGDPEFGQLFDRAPTEQSFKSDLRNLELTENHLRGFMQKDVLQNPLEGKKLRWEQIWKEANLPYNQVKNWLADSQAAIKLQAGNIVAHREGVFRKYMETVIRSPEKGPCYGALLINSNESYCLLNTLNEFAKHCREIQAQASGRSDRLKREMEQAYSAGINPGLRKGRVMADYMEALKTWQENEFHWFLYRELAVALENISMRLRKYYDTLFKPLREAFLTLRDICQDNDRMLHTQSAGNESYIIQPLEFQQRHRESFQRAVDTAAKGFLGHLAANLKRWLGTDLENLDNDYRENTDIPDFLTQYIEENFRDILRMNMQSLMNAKLAPGETIDHHIRTTLNNLRLNSIPMFQPNPAFQNQTAGEFTFLSVPLDCPDIVGEAKNYCNQSKDTVKTSSELSTLHWVKVIAGVPLYAFAKIQDMEESYEQKMANDETRKGIHLRYEWLREFPSPLVEGAWSSSYVGAYTKEYNSEMRALFQNCVDNGIIQLDVDKAWLYLADDSVELDRVQLHGNFLSDKLNNLEQVRGMIWGGERVELNPVGSYLINIPGQGILGNIRENTLRFYNICQLIRKQCQKLDAFQKLRGKLENPQLFAQALMSEMIQNAGMNIVFRRAAADPVPKVLFNMTKPVSYPEYEAYKQFCELMDQGMRQNIETQQDRAYQKVYGADYSQRNETELQRLRDGIGKIVERFTQLKEQIAGEIDSTELERQQEPRDKELFIDGVLETCTYHLGRLK